MKKAYSLLVGLTLFLMAAALSFAQEGDTAKDPAPSGKSDWDQQRCRGMMHPTMPQALIETKDGNIVVMTGSRLLKFDRDLNFIKEVELPIERDAMEKMKMGRRGECPWRKKMMQEESMMEQGSSPKEGSAPESE